MPAQQLPMFTSRVSVKPYYCFQDPYEEQLPIRAALGQVCCQVLLGFFQDILVMLISSDAPDLVNAPKCSLQGRLVLYDKPLSHILVTDRYEVRTFEPEDLGRVCSRYPPDVVDTPPYDFLDLPANLSPLGIFNIEEFRVASNVRERIAHVNIRP